MFFKPTSGVRTTGPSAAPGTSGGTANNDSSRSTRGPVFFRPPQEQPAAGAAIGRKILENPVLVCPPTPPPAQAPAPSAPVQPKWAHPDQQEGWMQPLPLPPRRGRPVMPNGPLDPCHSHGLETCAECHDRQPIPWF